MKMLKAIIVVLTTKHPKRLLKIAKGNKGAYSIFFIILVWILEKRIKNSI